MYSISHKSDAAYTFAIFLSYLRVEGIPSEVVMVRSNDGGEFSEETFGKMCRERNIKQGLNSQQKSLSTTVLQNES